jgi:hypothetical protein
VTLIIDTCNVLHRTGILPPELAGIDEGGLINLFSRSRYANRGAILACDGKPRDRAISRDTPGITMQFPGPGATADDLIIALIERSSAPKRLLVVTSDREVASAARKRRCRILDSDSFLAHLAHDAGKSGRGRTVQTGSAEDKALGVEDWIDQFELDEHLKGLAASEPPPPRPEESGDMNKPGDAPSSPPTPPSPEPWEALDTDELLRRYERGGDEPGTQA